jgi:sigma-B regulation protein RsbU (phosphoserine phosphatase)
MSDLTNNNCKEFKALLEITRALGATHGLDDLLAMIVSRSMALLDAERATIFLYDKERQELFSQVAEGASELRISIDTGLAGSAARSLQIINVPDVYQDDRFNPQMDKKTGYKTRSVLSCPLRDYDGQLVGVLQVLNKKHGTFGDNDTSLAEAFSAQAGVALQRAHLIEEYLEKQRLEDSLRIAREIQEKLLPQKAPFLAGFDIACWNRPCDATGGDYCDFLRLDDERLMVTLGDVSGHGVGPALVSCATRAMLRALSSVNNDIETVIRRVNLLMNSDLPDNRFVTAFLGILHSGEGKLTYCSAGHGPLLRLHAATSQVDILPANGIPVGILDDLGAISAQDVPMQTGDIFALLTDGFYEWARADGELFGIDRVTDIIRDHSRHSAVEVLNIIKDAVEKFADTPQADDLTAIIIKKTSG